VDATAEDDDETDAEAEARDDADAEVVEAAPPELAELAGLGAADGRLRSQRSPTRSDIVT
jgi:hypothetical protein